MWSANCVICEVNRASAFAVTDIKRCSTIGNLSIQNYSKHLKQIKLRFNALDALRLIIDNSNDKTNFLHKLLLNDRQVANLCETFSNISSGNMKLSKIQLSIIKQPSGFTVHVLGL